MGWEGTSFILLLIINDAVLLHQDSIKHIIWLDIHRAPRQWQLEPKWLRVSPRIIPLAIKCSNSMYISYAATKLHASTAFGNMNRLVTQLAQKKLNSAQVSFC